MSVAGSASGGFLAERVSRSSRTNDYRQAVRTTTQSGSVMAATILVTLAYVFMIAVNFVVVVAGFQTSARVGILALLAPVYMVTVGNWKLRTKYRRHLAAAWWLGLVCLILAVASG
jgi:hypothetical protein